MTEYERIYLASDYLNRTWGVMQFWASISFGLIAVAHFSSKHLTTLATPGLTILYIAFTLFVLSILKLNGYVVDGFLQDLRYLQGGGAALSEGAKIFWQPNLGS